MSDEPRRWTLYVNQHGSVVGQWEPNVQTVEVMPVSEHDAEVERLQGQVYNAEQAWAAAEGELRTARAEIERLRHLTRLQKWATGP